MGPLSTNGARSGPTNNIGPVPGRTPGLMPPATPPPVLAEATGPLLRLESIVVSRLPRVDPVTDDLR